VDPNLIFTDYSNVPVFIPTGFLGSILRIQGRSHRVSRYHGDHRSSDSRAAVVFPVPRRVVDGWHPALLRLLRRVVLHHVVAVDGPVLLCLWLPIPRVRHPSGYLCRNFHCIHVLPVVSICPIRSAVLLFLSIRCVDDIQVL
jgi:hypothetical protein